MKRNAGEALPGGPARIQTRAQALAAALSHAQTRTTDESPGTVDPIDHVNLDDKVYARVRSMLASGRLEPGSRIVQEDLAAMLGVSRTPLVNALKRLAQEGLLTWVPRRGIFVRSLDAAELARLFEVRACLEPLAAELAARAITRQEALDMERTWTSMAELPDTPESHGLFVERDRAFHWRLAELSGNSYLMAALAPVNALASAYLHGAPRPWEDTVPDHLSIIEGLRNGDPTASAQAMRHHISLTLDALRIEAAGQPASTGSSHPHPHKE